MNQRFRIFPRNGGVYYCEDTATGKQTSLRTRDEGEARRLLNAKNEAEQIPSHARRQIGLTYLASSDPALATRTWRFAFQELIKTKQGENARRWGNAVKDKAFIPILDLPIIETHAEHFLSVLNAGTVSTNVFLSRIHNFALDLSWLPLPIIPKRQWPKVRYKDKRAITEEEHRKIVAREKNPERRAFYELCWETGGSQTDVALLCAEDIDWKTRILFYRRKKNKQPARFEFDEGDDIERILRSLPQQGPLFPNLRLVESKDRATEFKQRCEG